LSCGIFSKIDLSFLASIRISGSKMDMNLFFIANLLLVLSCFPFYSYGIVDFQKEIWPILEKRCIECHKAPYVLNGRKKDPKAGLRLDGASHIMSGSDDGPVVIVDHPSRSSLYKRVILPASDDDIMPPKGDPLSFREQELLRMWIAQGLDFGKWVGATDNVPEKNSRNYRQESNQLPEYLKFYDKLASGLTPISSSEISKLNLGDFLLIRPIGFGNPLLEVRCVTNQNNFTDKTLTKLLAIRDNVAIMDIRNSHLTDRAGEILSQFPNLIKLNLRSTQMGDNGVTMLAKLRNLQSLNLSETQVSDGILEKLVSFPSLTNLYLWKSEVSREKAKLFKSENAEIVVTY